MLRFAHQLRKALLDRRQHPVVGHVIELTGTANFGALDAMATPKVLGSTLLRGRVMLRVSA